MIGQRLQRIDRELDHRHVGLGIEVGEHAPGAVVEAPLVAIRADPERLGDLRHLLGKLGQAGRRIVEIEEFLRKAVEVVNRARLWHSGDRRRSEEHTSELQSLMRISYAVFCLKKKKNNTSQT